MPQKLKKAIANERGDTSYFSTVIYIFVCVLMIAFILNVFSIISTKRKLDLAADQMVKQIQLAGGVNASTEELFAYLTENLPGASNITYSIETSYMASTPSGMTGGVQLGTPFYLTIRAEYKLGGFWNLDVFSITLVSRAAGVGERYWK